MSRTRRSGRIGTRFVLSTRWVAAGHSQGGQAALAPDALALRPPPLPALTGWTPNLVYILAALRGGLDPDRLVGTVFPGVESPAVTGRVIAALAGDPAVLARTGHTYWGSELAGE
ncbi:hypothetical protein [Nocardia sp. X0981]